MPYGPEATGPRIIGYALRQSGAMDIDSRSVRALSRVSEGVADWMTDYPQEVKDAYDDMMNWAKVNSTPEQRRQVYLRFVEYCLGLDPKDSAFRDKVNALFDPITADTERVNAFALVLKGLEEDVADTKIEYQERMNALQEQQMPDKQDLYREALMRRFGERFNIPDIQMVERKHLAALFGNLLAVNMDEAQRFAYFCRQHKSVFGTKISDDLSMALDALGSREGGTLPTVLKFTDISRMTLKEQDALFDSLSGRELVMVAAAGLTTRSRKTGEITRLRPMDVFDFLLTPVGRKIFRRNPYDSYVHGAIDYIEYLRQLYPDAASGLDAVPNFNVGGPGGLHRWVPAKILDGGVTDTEGLTDVEVSMLLSTWGYPLKVARGLVHILMGPTWLYRKGWVSNDSSERQKGLNYSNYLDNYQMLGSDRQYFFIFGGLGERMMQPPLEWLGPQKKFGPDMVDPFQPRPWGERNGGIQLKESEFRSPEERVRLQVLLTDLFYAAEQDPYDNAWEVAVATVVAAANDYYINCLDDKVSRRSCTPEEVIRLAQKWNKVLREKLVSFCDPNDPNLDKLMMTRQFFPLPASVTRMKLDHLDDESVELLNRTVNWKGLVQRLGGSLKRADGTDIPDSEFDGVVGAKKVVDLMGGGWWCRFGSLATAAENTPDKTGGYVLKTAEAYQEIVNMSRSGIQALSDDLEKEAGESLLKARDLDDRALQTIDDLVSALRGINTSPELRLGSVRKMMESYTKLTNLVGYVGQLKGIWWVYRRAVALAEDMCGKRRVLRYLAADRSYTGTKEKGNRLYEPIIPGKQFASYGKLYKNLPQEALALLNCYVDEGEVVSPGRMSPFYPVAMAETRGGRLGVDPGRENNALQFGHMKQVVGPTKLMIEKFRDHLWKIVVDSELASEGFRDYFDVGISSLEDEV